VAKRLVDLSALLGRLPTASRNFIDRQECEPRPGVSGPGHDLGVEIVLVGIDHPHAQEVARFGVEMYSLTKTRPSISGASAAERAIVPSSSTSSTSTSISRPIFAASNSAEISSCNSISRCRRSSRTLPAPRRAGIGRRAVDRRIGKAADAIETRLGDERQQFLELGFALARENR
jgi:hypothetical protein